MPLTKHITIPNQLNYWFGILFIIFSPTFQIQAQELELEFLNKYSVFTDYHVSSSLYPNPRAAFVDGKDTVYFHLTFNRPGLSLGTYIGKIENQNFSIIDTMDLVGAPDRFLGFFYDDNHDIYYCNRGFHHATVKKIAPDGNTIWEHVDSTENKYTPGFFLQAENGSPMMLARKIYPDETVGHTLTEFNPDSGAINWEIEIIEPGLSYFTPNYIKEYDDHFQVLLYNFQNIYLAKIDKNGTLISAHTSYNTASTDIFKYVQMDDFQNTYIGRNTGGYRMPKLSPELDTIWLFEKNTVSGYEALNRTENITLDDSLNIYVGGPYKISMDADPGLLVSKVNSDGELIWEFMSMSYFSDEYFLPFNTFLNNNKLWVTGYFMENFGNQDRYAGLLCLNTSGELLLSEKFTDLGPKGFAASMDFYEDEFLITASSEVSPDSVFQHILHYRVDTVTTSASNLPEQVLISPYPNPTSDYISIRDLDLRQVESIGLTTMQGQNIQINPSMIQNGQLDLSGWSAGAYILDFTLEGKKYLAKIIKR